MVSSEELFIGYHPTPLLCRVRVALHFIPHSVLCICYAFSGTDISNDAPRQLFHRSRHLDAGLPTFTPTRLVFREAVLLLLSCMLATVPCLSLLAAMPLQMLTSSQRGRCRGAKLTGLRAAHGRGDE
eukprot:3572033-Rhodomonas_salina.1